MPDTKTPEAAGKEIPPANDAAGNGPTTSTELPEELTLYCETARNLARLLGGDKIVSAEEFDGWQAAIAKVNMLLVLGMASRLGRVTLSKMMPDPTSATPAPAGVNGQPKPIPTPAEQQAAQPAPAADPASKPEAAKPAPAQPTPAPAPKPEPPKK